MGCISDDQTQYSRGIHLSSRHVLHKKKQYHVSIKVIQVAIHKQCRLQGEEGRIPRNMKSLLFMVSQLVCSITKGQEISKKKRTTVSFRNYLTFKKDNLKQGEGGARREGSKTDDFQTTLLMHEPHQVDVILVKPHVTCRKLNNCGRQI